MNTMQLKLLQKFDMCYLHQISLLYFVKKFMYSTKRQSIYINEYQIPTFYIEINHIMFVLTSMESKIPAMTLYETNIHNMKEVVTGFLYQSLLEQYRIE